MKKLWAGRFQEETADIVEDFTESVSFDYRLWADDIDGSIAHTKMLARQGIINKRDAQKIVKGLKDIASEIGKGEFEWKKELEDVHMNIEAALIEKIGPVGGKLHTARSRNDQIALDLRLYLREEMKGLIDMIKRVQSILLRLADRHSSSFMPGYTHLQRAQPVILGHHLLAYVEMLQRDRARYEDALKRVNTLPLGSCALAGTTLPIDRAFVAKLLRFERISENSMDAVSDRDFVIEFISVGAIMMTHLSRLAEDLILWSTVEFSFVELPEAFTTGSSIMPQKRNPDVTELIRGKTGRVFGSLMSVLTMMKALPLTYNRDMQEDKIPLFDTVDTLKAILRVLSEMLPKISFNTERMNETSSHNYSLATDIAEYLVRKGLPFREAHELTGRIVRYALGKKVELHELMIDELKEFSSIIGSDIYKCLVVEESVKKRRSRGGTSPSQVKRQIARFRKIV
jgi:argininosuccinate lyase